MLKRPTNKEDEDDLLHFQEIFLREKSAPAAKVQRVAARTDVGERDVVSLDVIADGDGDPEVQDRKPELEYASKKRLEKNDNAKSNEENLDASEMLDRHDCHITAVLTKIKEKDTSQMPTAFGKNMFVGGFPTVPDLSEEQYPINRKSDKKKQSLFAKQFKSHSSSMFGLKLQESVPMSQCNTATASEVGLKVDPSLAVSLPATSHFITGEGIAPEGKEAEREKASIHLENASRLSAMAEEDILQEQRKLKAALDPKILSFLKSKRIDHNSAVEPRIDSRGDTSMVMDMTDDCVKEKKTKVTNDNQAEVVSLNPHAEFHISRDIPGMEIVEDDKLQWMTKAPKPVWRDIKKQTEMDARFDLNGNLVSRTADIPFSAGLHHHGEEPHAPGYTLGELFHLARCNFQQQRVFALQLLARILEQYHRGSFRDHLQNSLLKQLIDSGLPFLLRWSLDDSCEAIFSAAIFALKAMLIVPCDHLALDKLLYSDRGFEIPCLRPINMNAKAAMADIEETKELNDPEMMQQDVIKGLIQIQILPRLRYILEVCKPCDTTIEYCMAILTRIALHSTESAYQILRCPRLIQTICSDFLQFVWTKEVTELGEKDPPRVSALKLVRYLCVSGRSIAAKLWSDFDIGPRILRYVALLTEDNMKEDESVKYAVESLHIWRICLSYGIAFSSTRDVYPLLISMLQKCVSKSINRSGNVIPSIILLCEAIVQSTSIIPLEMSEGSSDSKIKKAVRFEEAECVEEQMLEWSLVSGIHPIIMKLIQERIHHVCLSEEIEDEEVDEVACSLFYLSAYIDNAIQQKSLSKVDLLSELELMLEDIVLKLLHSKTLSNILCDMSRHSEIATQPEYLSFEESIDSLPNYGINIFKNGSNFMQKSTSYHLAMSINKLLLSITTFHKGCSDKVLHFMTSDAILTYLKFITSSKTSAKICSISVSSSAERQFLYYLIMVFRNIADQIGLEKVDPCIIKVYHLASLKLLNLLQNGEEFQALQLFANVVTLKGFFLESNLALLTAGVSELQLSRDKKQINPDQSSLLKLLSIAVERLPLISNTYSTACFGKLRRQIKMSETRIKRNGKFVQSFLLPAGNGAILPVDWMFFPITELQNLSTNVELSGNIITQLSLNTVETIERTLLFVILLEIWRPECLSGIPLTIRFVRILCVFLIGNDAFLESTVHSLLELFIKLFTSSENLKQFDFEMNFPSISSFHDLYNSLLDQYSASSFGDPVFSNFLLIPLQQRHSSKYRKAVWSKNEVLRVFNLPIKSVKIALENFLEIQEEDEDMLKIYLRNISDGSARAVWCPFLYLIAVHHLSNFIFSTKDLEDYSVVKVNKKRLKLLNQVLMINNEDVRMDLLMYDKPDQNQMCGFTRFKKLPGFRQLLIDNKDKVAAS